MDDSYTNAVINEKLLNPKSIVVVGGSCDLHKPGGKILRNLINGGFKGDLYVANPKLERVQGIKSYKSLSDLPDNVDLAIIAIASKYCLETVNFLSENKNTRAFIILSAGFSEESEEGRIVENEIVKAVDKVNGTLIGPNCIGFLNENYNGVFTTPIPTLNSHGIDFISGSGATAVFVMESSIPKGLSFSSVYSVGNCAQIGVEEVLKHLDETFDPEKSSKIKLLYIESIKKPQLLLKHASSLIEKGCKIAAVKSGSSDAGSRAASSHTGALANSDLAVSALFRKAGIVRCSSREELATIASIFTYPQLKGENIAVITHAGGPAVMLTDALSFHGLKVPCIEGKNAENLKNKLFPGSSVANPIDFLATGTADQLGLIIDACENEFDNIDAMAVIFGSPGLFPVDDVYDLLAQKMETCKKPIYPILPSVINAENEIKLFLQKGKSYFSDEVLFGDAIAKVYMTDKPSHATSKLPACNQKKIKQIIEKSDNGYLSPGKVQELLDAANIPQVKEAMATNREEAINKGTDLGYPIVMKVVGPIHKSDVGGVSINIKDSKSVAQEFDRMIKIEDTTAILLQPMLSGTELFVGAKRNSNFGHIILCGMGGVFIEIFKDISSNLAPIDKDNAQKMIRNLKCYPLIKGARGTEPVNEELFSDIIVNISALVEVAPEIFEMDLNPLLGNSNQVVAVDARIRIEKIR